MYMCSVLLPPGGYPVEVNKYNIYNNLRLHECNKIKFTDEETFAHKCQLVQKYRYVHSH